jgi:hypothetical protein
VSEPDAPTYAEMLARLIEEPRPWDELLARLRVARGTAPDPDAKVLEVLRDFLAENAFRARGAVLHGEGTLTAEAQVIKRTVPKSRLLEQYVRLPCGQQLGVLVVFLLLLFSFDLPSDVQEKLWGLITELGAAIWMIQRITKKR